MRSVVEYSEDSEVKCPYADHNVECQEPISEREIRAVNEKIFNLFIVDCQVLKQDELEAFYMYKRGLHQAEASDSNSFYCKTGDSYEFRFYEDEVRNLF